MVDPLLWAKCRIKTSLEDLISYLAAFQPAPGVVPLLVAYSGKLMLLVPLVGGEEPCVLEADAGSEAEKKYLVIELKRGGYNYKFANELPETLESKVYPIIHCRG